jgi:apolipoprotein D and lipocalin family protein
MMKPAHPFAVLLVAILLAACSGSQRPLPTVPTVDLDRYYGVWYEIARLPNRFQAMCVSDTRALYRPDGENVSVLNQCRTADGMIEQAEGIAKPVEGSQGAKLRVSFFRPFYGDYWILELDPDYRWVLVGEPGRRYAWILARETTLDAVTLERLLARAAALGFDRQAFVRTAHAGATR